MYIVRGNRRNALGQYEGDRLATLDTCRNAYESAACVFSFILGYATKMRKGSEETLYIGYGGVVDLPLKEDISRNLNRMVQRYATYMDSDIELLRSSDRSSVTIVYDDRGQSFTVKRVSAQRQSFFGQFFEGLLS